MALDIRHTRDLIHEFDFHTLFVEELGWSRPPSRQAVTMNVGGAEFTRKMIAELGGVVVFEIVSHEGSIPDAHTRLSIYNEIAAQHHENLLIFINSQRTQSLWYWVKREGTRKQPREHLYVQGQPGDLFLTKLQAMVVEISDFENGPPSVIEVAGRLRKALDVEQVTKNFYSEFQSQHVEFLKLIEGIPHEPDRRWYASVILNRLMFVYFLQRKGFVDHNNDYLQTKLAESRRRGHDRFYSEFLQALFFEGFARPKEKRSLEANALIGDVKYLNGGLFLKHKIELTYADIRIPDRAFENVLNLFQRFSWNLNDTPGGQDDELNPDVLGYIFEKYINQKTFGAYYTRPEITDYLCERTIHKLILDQINTPGIPGVLPERRFESMEDLLMKLDADLCRRLLDILPKLSLLDPACGSGAFLVAAMKTLITIYAAITGKIKFLNDRNLSAWLSKAENEHPSLQYFVKKSIITDNLFGVDLMEEATEIARLRLFLALVSSVSHAQDLEPLPNIDFNIMPGNSLIGLLKVDPDKVNSLSQLSLFFGGYRYEQIVAEKNRMIETYRHTASFAKDLQELRDSIDEKKGEARAVLNDILLQQFKDLGIRYERAALSGKARKRALKLEDITALEPFH